MIAFCGHVGDMENLERRICAMVLGRSEGLRDALVYSSYKIDCD